MASILKLIGLFYGGLIVLGLTIRVMGGAVGAAANPYFMAVAIVFVLGMGFLVLPQMFTGSRGIISEVIDDFRD
ncbi:hypothetical protein JMJ58_03770 [Haloterrigena salifodinae]|uniref:Uncharacterized protein n=1 Tax=Haloterrigena salifodinae TaxID=2675099 RepID=A0A8T8E363_9EURY|nr:hypothetical protein [Haloterrigena salifodinae]QRV16027.1 hypothetical protein JMJ58_03770 [Haloterrigena salifodinae]